MRSTTTTGRISGIRIRVHYTWFIAFILIAIVVVTQFPQSYPLLQRIGLGMVASLIFLAAIVIREIVLGVMAASRGIPIKRVTLFIFGGLYQVAKEVTLPVVERLLAVVGLISNLVIAGICYVILIVVVGVGNIVFMSLFQWLSLTLVLLALLHFLPGFPLDGGRFLRAFLWSATGSYRRAARITAWVGRGIGLSFIVGGLLLMAITHQWSFGAVMVVAGWSLQSAAAQNRREVLLLEGLRNIVAQDLMSREYTIINRQVTIGELIRDDIITMGHNYFLVTDDDKLQGVVTVKNIKRIPRRRWDATTIGEIMAPVDKVKTAYPQQPVVSVLEQMEDSGIEQMPVVDENCIIGIINRDSLIRLVSVRTELRM